MPSWNPVMWVAKAARATRGGRLRPVGTLAADGVEVHGQARGVGGSPQRLPDRIVERGHVVGIGHLDAARSAALGHPLDLGYRRLDGEAGDAGQPRVALGMCPAEVGEPLVVDAHHLRGRLGILKSIAGAENAVEHFRLHSVALLVLEAQVRVGEPAHAAAPVVVEPGGGHAVGAVDLSRHVLAAGRAHAVDQPELRALLRDPDRPLGPVGHIGHPVPHGRRRVRGEEIRRQPDQVEMAVGGDDAVVHVGSPHPPASLTV